MAHGQREQEKTVDSEEEKVEAEKKDKAIVKEIRHFLGGQTLRNESATAGRMIHFVRGGFFVSRQRVLKTNIVMRSMVETMGFFSLGSIASHLVNMRLVKELHRLSKTDTRKPFMLTS